MIRRNPTLIPMGDFEVQDIRDMYAEKRAEYDDHRQLLEKIKRLAESPELLKENPELSEHFNKIAKQQEKAQRLGLDEADPATSADSPA